MDVASNLFDELFTFIFRNLNISGTAPDFELKFPVGDPNTPRGDHVSEFGFRY